MPVQKNGQHVVKLDPNRPPCPLGHFSIFRKTTQLQHGKNVGCFLRFFIFSGFFTFFGFQIFFQISDFQISDFSFFFRNVKNIIFVFLIIICDLAHAHTFLNSSMKWCRWNTNEYNTWKLKMGGCDTPPF